MIQKLEDLNIRFNVKEIICDFELNIHKSIDDILPSINILGCFFHLSKSFKKKLDKKKMKLEYENNHEFYKFIKQAVALSHLPLSDIQIGMEWLKDTFEFADPRVAAFKEEFLEYIDTYWINGCFPPYVWNTWGRSDDYTNNNQEGFNSKMSKELRQVHPSPGILLCFLQKQIILAEFKSIEARVGELGPRQLKKHKRQAGKRLQLKRNFETAKRLRGADIKSLVGEYLSIMGYNVVSSTMYDRTTDIPISSNRENIIEVGDVNTSNWQVEDDTIDEEIEQGDNPYSGRQVGISARQQEENQVRSGQWWRGATCPSCRKGFTARSSKRQCHSCDKFTHDKSQCVSKGDDDAVFVCKACKPVDMEPKRTKTNEVIQCKRCVFKSNFKYNMKRHIVRVHGGVDEPEQDQDVAVEVREETDALNPVSRIIPEKPTLTAILREINLDHLLDNFLNEGVDLDMLVCMTSSDLKECLKEVNINRFGDRYKICERLRTEKLNVTRLILNDPSNVSEPLENREEVVVVLRNDDIAVTDISEIISGNATEVVTDDFDIVGHVESIGDLTTELNEVTVSSNLTQGIYEVPCLCSSSRHLCQLCYRPVCNFCSDIDPNQSNEMLRVHKLNDQCSGQRFECPTCEKYFSTPNNLQEHMTQTHNEEESLTLPSEAGSEWSILNRSVGETDNVEKQFDDSEHIDIEIDENRSVGEADEVEKQIDAIEIEETVAENIEFSPPYTRKRIRQNLKDVDFSQDSDDDLEWSADTEDDDDHRESSHTKNSNPKRKKLNISSESRKQKATSEFKCDDCEVSFTRKDNLKRHVDKKHK